MFVIKVNLSNLYHSFSLFSYFLKDIIRTWESDSITLEVRSFSDQHVHSQISESL